MLSGTIGQKIKYTKPDAYPGYRPPSEIMVGESYTIANIGERPRDHRLAGDLTFELEEVPGSVYGSKRFEPYVGPKVHKGFNIKV